MPHYPPSVKPTASNPTKRDMNKTDQLQSGINSQSVERKIRSAFCAFARVPGRRFTTTFEHGQWWVIETLPSDDCDTQTWAVEDASSPDSIDGFVFERV